VQRTNTKGNGGSGKDETSTWRTLNGTKPIKDIGKSEKKFKRRGECLTRLRERRADEEPEGLVVPGANSGVNFSQNVERRRN